MPRRHCARTAPISSGSSYASACWSTSRAAISRTTIIGETVPLPIALAPIGLAGMQHPHGEIARLPRRAGGRHSVHALHHVDLLDRGCGGGGRQAILVPALRDEGSRLCALSDRASRCRQMQRAGADHRPAGARPAPLRCAQRALGAARRSRSAMCSTSRPSRAGPSACCEQAQDLRQSLRLCAQGGTDVKSLRPGSRPSSIPT